MLKVVIIVTIHSKMQVECPNISGKRQILWFLVCIVVVLMLVEVCFLCRA